MSGGDIRAFTLRTGAGRHQQSRKRQLYGRNAGVFLIKRKCGMKKEHYFQSSDEKTSLHAIVWEPEGSVKAVLQITHGSLTGMTDLPVCSMSTASVSAGSTFSDTA